MRAIKTAFNGGEFSPLMVSRVDAEKHPFSARIMENFIPKVYGGAFRRPGTIYLDEVGDDTDEVRLIAFNVSATARYVLELGDLYCRIWNSDGTLLTDSSGTVSLTTPYRGEDIFDVQFVVLNNVGFFTHPLYTQQRITRAYDDSESKFLFTWDAMPIDTPCFRDTNQTVITATPAAVTGTTTIAFSSDIFDEHETLADYIGAKIEITHRREESHITLDLDATGTSSSINVVGTFSVITYGTWDGELLIQQQDETGAWIDIRSFTSVEDRNVSLDSFVDENRALRLDYTATTAGTGAPRAVLEVDDSRESGIATITGITYPAGVATAAVTIDSDLVSTDATTLWSLEAWGEYCGYPRCIAFHESRLWFGGTNLEPNTFWASKQNGFFDYERGVFDADSLSFTLAAQEGSSINSMLSHEALIFFTESEEWTATTSDKTAISPTNIFVRRQSRYGSDFQQSIIASNSILFVQRGSRKLRDFIYSARESGGQSEDLSVLSEHLVRSGIKQIALQQQPDPVLWVVTDDGDLVSVTYEANQNVTGWTKHPTTGTVESVAVIYGTSPNDDEVWIVANRNSSRYVERINPQATIALEDEDTEKMVYTDSSVIYDGAATTTITGLDHLEGLEVDIVADGSQVTAKTVSSGSITLDAAASFVVVGLSYTSTLQPSIIATSLEDGTSLGRRVVCKQVHLQLWKSRGIELADSSTSTFYDIGATTLTTGEIDVNNGGSHRDNIDVTVRQTAPYPAAILAMILEFDILG